jgi:hypothetical protein
MNTGIHRKMKPWKGNFFCNELLLDCKKIIKLGKLPKEKYSVFGKTSETTEGLCVPVFVWLSAGLTLTRISVMITMDNGEASLNAMNQKRTRPTLFNFSPFWSFWNLLMANFKRCHINIDEAWNTLVSELCVRAQYWCYETRVFLCSMYTV